jgi:hypothetical protein
MGPGDRPEGDSVLATARTGHGAAPAPEPTEWTERPGSLNPMTPGDLSFS